MYLAGNVPCYLPEWLLPAALWQHQGCTVRGKTSHTKSRPYLTGCTLQLLSPGRAWAPAQLLPISGFSPNICISPKYFLDIHSREQGDAHEMPGKLPVLSLCLSALRECAAAIGHHSPL